MKLSDIRAAFRFWMRLVGLAGLGLIFFTESAPGAEPMMDRSIFESSRAAGFNLVRDGRFQDAIQVEEKALRIAQDRFGPIHPSLVPLFNDLATLHRYLAEYKKAEQEYKWGLALQEKNSGPDHSLVADSLDRLAALYNDLGRNVEAELLEKRALEIRRAEASRNPQGLIQTLSQLGRIELSLKNDSQAQTLLQQALETLEKNPNSDAGLLISLLDSLAQTYQSEQAISKAQSCLEKALDKAKKDFHPDSPQVADAMEKLADFFHAQNQDEKAKPLYQSTLQIDRRFVGTVYSYLSLPYLKRLAKVELSTGNVKDSEDLWKKSIQTEKEIFGPRHPQVAMDLIHLAEVESALKEKSKAQEYLKESLKILKNYFLDDHPM
ncbi:MAG TPA: tetratricopeptide repeat protein, partial [bacterium]